MNNFRVDILQLDSGQIQLSFSASRIFPPHKAAAIAELREVQNLECDKLVKGMIFRFVLLRMYEVLFSNLGAMFAKGLHGPLAYLTVFFFAESRKRRSTCVLPGKQCEDLFICVVSFRDINFFRDLKI